MTVAIFLDNILAVRLLRGERRTRCSQQRKLQDEFTALAQQWTEQKEAICPRTPVEVHWIPGHQGIQGNEEADLLAKQAARAQNPQSAQPPTASYLRQLARSKTLEIAQAFHAEEAPRAYKTLGIPLHSKGSRKVELSLPRHALSRLLAARSGHGDFAAYHERFNHADYTGSCSCNRLKTPYHFFYCPAVRKRWKDRWRIPQRVADKRSPSEKIAWLLSTPAGADEFCRFVLESSFFEDTCPAHRATPSE